MTQETPTPLPPLTKEQRAVVSGLSSQQLAAIDEAILMVATSHWRKVAMVVALAMDHSSYVSGVPDTFYGQRVLALVEEGRLEARGNVEYIRFSEVRLSQSKNGPVHGVA